MPASPHGFLRRCAAALAFVFWAAEGHAATAPAQPAQHKTTQSVSYVSMEPLYASILDGSRSRGLLMVEMGLDVPDGKLRDKVNQALPTLRDAYVRSLLVYAATSVRPWRQPNVEDIANPHADHHRPRHGGTRRAGADGPDRDPPDALTPLPLFWGFGRNKIQDSSGNFVLHAIKLGANCGAIRCNKAIFRRRSSSSSQDKHTATRDSVDCRPYSQAKSSPVVGWHWAGQPLARQYSTSPARISALKRSVLRTGA